MRPLVFTAPPTGRPQATEPTIPILHISCCMVRTFGLRMQYVKQVRKERVPEPEDFNIQDYNDKVFWMYHGKEEEVTLRCRLRILDQVFDRFGTGIDLKNVTKETFDVTVPVCVSSTFYAWMAQYVGEMTLIAPGYVKDMYAAYLQEALDDVLGSEELWAHDMKDNQGYAQ